MVKSNRPLQQSGGSAASAARALAAAPASSSVKSAQATAAANSTPYGPVSRVSNADASLASTSGRIVDCRVTFLDDTNAIFRVPVKAKGSVLLKQVFKHLRVLEPEYFGLQYRDAGDIYYWIDFEKPLNRHPGLTIPSSDAPMNFVFCVKFYSPDPAYLEDEFTRYLFVLQLRRDLATGHLVCQDHTAALLAAYVVQAEEGDFNRDNYRDYTYLLKYRFHPRQDVNFLRLVMENHVELVGQNPAEADLNYLEIARRCEMYGIRLHDAILIKKQDHECVALQLAVSHMGINVSQAHQKINLFSWAKIRKLSFKRKKFLIKLHPETYQGYCKDTVEFMFDSRNSCKSFWKKCIEHHVFFRGRTNDAQNMSRSRSRMFQYGSHFRFTGRTQRQVVECMKETLTKRSVSASATPNRSHHNTPAARQASVGGGGGTLPSSKSYTATLTATPLLPIAQMRRPLPNRFNTTGGSRIVQQQQQQRSDANNASSSVDVLSSRQTTTEATQPATTKAAPLLPNVALSSSSSNNNNPLAPLHVVAVPPTSDKILILTEQQQQQIQLPRPDTMRTAESQQQEKTTTRVGETAAQATEEDVDKTPTQTRRQSNVKPQPVVRNDSVQEARRESTTSTLSKKSTQKAAEQTTMLSTAFNGDDENLPTPPAYGNESYGVVDTTATSSDNTTPTTVTPRTVAASITSMHEREFIEEYVMPVPPLEEHRFMTDNIQTAQSSGGNERDEDSAAGEEEDSLTGMNMTEEVPYVLYRRKVKWDKFLTYPPPPQQQQQQQLLSPEEYSSAQEHHHRHSAQQLEPTNALLFSDATQQQNIPYTTFTRYLDQTTGGETTTLDGTKNGGASVIADVQIEQQRLLPTSVPVLLTSGHRTKSPSPQLRSTASQQQDKQKNNSIDGSNEALIAAMPSTKLRVLDYVAVNRNRLPPVSMCYSYEDDSVSIDSLQRQLFESIKRKQEARIRQSAPTTQQSTRASSRNAAAFSNATPSEIAATAHRAGRRPSQDEHQSPAKISTRSLSDVHAKVLLRSRSRSTDSIASTASSASSSASEASYNTTSVDDGDDVPPVAREDLPKHLRSAEKKARRTLQQPPPPPPPLFVSKHHRTKKPQQISINNNNENLKDLAFADESTATATDNNNVAPLQSSTTTAHGSSFSSSDEQYYKAIRQRQQQSLAAMQPPPSSQLYSVDPDELAVPPPPPPEFAAGAATTLNNNSENRRHQFLYDYEENPARAYLLEQQRRSRSLNAPRKNENSPPPPAMTPSEVAAAMMMMVSHRRPSYDLAVTAGRMLANGGHGTGKPVPTDGGSGALKARRVAGSRASAIGSHGADAGLSTAQTQDQQQQPLNAMSTTLPVYPSYEGSIPLNGAITPKIAPPGRGVNGRRLPHDPMSHKHRPNGNNNPQYQHQLVQRDSSISSSLPPPPGSASTSSAHNDFSESELNAFVEMSYQDLQATVREYSLSSDRFTSSEGISTASSVSGESPDFHRTEFAPYPPLLYHHHQHHQPRAANAGGYAAHRQKESSAAGVRQSNHIPHGIKISNSQTVQQPQRGETTTTIATTTSHTDESSATSSVPPSDGVTPSPSTTSACSSSSTAEATAHASGDRSSRPGKQHGNRRSHHRHHSDDIGSEADDQHIIPNNSEDSPAMLLETEAVPNLQLDTVLIAQQRQQQTVQLLPVTKNAEATTFPKPPLAGVESHYAPLLHTDDDDDNADNEQHQFSPPPPPLPELRGDGQYSASLQPHDTSTVQPQQTQVSSTSYMDEWRAKMRELEQLTGVTSPSSTTSPSNADDYTTTSSTQSQDVSPVTEEQHAMPIIPPPVEFGNNNNQDSIIRDDEDDDGDDNGQLPEMHGASGVRYGSTGGRLFQLSAPRAASQHAALPSGPAQQPTAEAVDARQDARDVVAAAAKLPDDAIHTSRL